MEDKRFNYGEVEIPDDKDLNKMIPATNFDHGLKTHSFQKNTIFSSQSISRLNKTCFLVANVESNIRTSTATATTKKIC